MTYFLVILTSLVQNEVWSTFKFTQKWILLHCRTNNHLENQKWIKVHNPNNFKVDQTAFWTGDQRKPPKMSCFASGSKLVLHAYFTGSKYRTVNGKQRLGIGKNLVFSSLRKCANPQRMIRSEIFEPKSPREFLLFQRSYYWPAVT